MAIRFIHAADIHLGSSMHGLSEYDGAPAATTWQSAAQDACRKLVDHAIASRVDFVVLAGDVWNSSSRDLRLITFFAGELARLAQNNITVHMVLGNHDAQSRIAQELEGMANLDLYPSTHAATIKFTVADQPIAIHGRSYQSSSAPRNLCASYPAAVPGALNIGLLHTSLEPQANSPYAPCGLEDLRSKNYDYWALGHVHSKAEFELGPHSRAAYPGILQGRHAGETGPKGALLVTLSPATPAHIEFLPCAVLNWTELVIDAGQTVSLNQISTRVAEALSQLLAAPTPANTLLAARLTITGATPLHGQLRYRAQQLWEQLVIQAAKTGSPHLLIEKCLVQTTAPQESTTHDSSAIATMRRLLDSLGTDQEFRRKLNDLIANYVSDLPAEVGTQMVHEQIIDSGADGPFVGDHKLAEHIQALHSYLTGPDPAED